MNRDSKKRAISMFLSLSMGVGLVSPFNTSNTFAEIIEESTNFENMEESIDIEATEESTKETTDVEVKEENVDAEIKEASTESVKEEVKTTGPFVVSGGVEGVDYVYEEITYKFNKYTSSTTSIGTKELKTNVLKIKTS